MYRVADQIIEFVEKTCSKNIFVLTGNGAMYLNDAIELSEKLNYICVRNEAAAPVAASSSAEVTGLTGVVCVTAGPGSTNALAGLAEIWVDSGNVLVISGQVPTSVLGTGGSAPFNTRTFGIAGIPIIDYVKNLTKFATSIMSPSEVKHALQEIYRALNIGRKGPVWLDIPLDIQSMPAISFSMDELIQELKNESQSTNDITTDEIHELEMLLQKSSRPLFILGRGVSEMKHLDRFIDWLEKSHLPFALSRVMAHEVPIGVPSNMGVLGVRGRPWSKEVLGKADLIVALGCRLPTSIVGEDFSYLSQDVRIAMVDIDLSEIQRHGDRVALGINKSLSNFAQICASLDTSINNLAVEAWFEFCTRLKSLPNNDLLAQEENGPLNIYWFVKHLEDYIKDERVILTSDAGSNYYACGQAIDFNKFSKEVTSGTFAAMGISLPLAIGAAAELVGTDGLVFCVTGDGSIELNIQELLTLSTYKLPVKIFVINNGGYASMRTWQDNFFEGRYIGSTDDTGAKPLNFERVAYAFGIDYVKIENPKDYHSKMSKITETRIPQLIEVMCRSDQRLHLPMEIDKV
jgi:acetolactate synthase-1/2/3 large subunit